MKTELAACIEAARDKKAEDIVILDLRNLSDFTDYFLLCHGSSERQILAIADAVEERLAKDLGIRPNHVEGRRSSEWILMDYIDFVVHVFVQAKRSFYGLERLWGDAPRIEVADEAEPKQRPARARRPRPTASG